MTYLLRKPRPEDDEAGARSGELLALPRNTAELDEAVRRAKQLVTKRAAFACVASLVPLPGLDIAVDVAAVTRLIPDINKEFGLTPQQIARLNPRRRMLVYKSIVAIGSMMIGKLVTHELATQALKVVGVRMAAKQLGKYVPVAGQALAVALGFTAIKYVGHQHVTDCRRVIEKTLAESA